MKNRIPFVVSSSFVLLLIAFASCKKINEATELGKDLIPPVDNINTFADTLTVETYNEVFSALSDTINTVGPSAIHYLGQINNDPLFGKTNASIFLELKPPAAKYYFEDHDVISIDSVVLVLNYRDLYGDSTIEQQVTVSEIAQSANFRSDSLYQIRRPEFETAGQLGTKTFLPKTLNDSVFGYKESAANQLRIRLDNSFGQRLLNYDSTNAYLSDSAFRTYFKGFAVKPSGGSGNAVMGFALADTNTKLSIYYNYVKGAKKDTAMRNFYFNTVTGANANSVKRDYNSGEIKSHLNTGTPDQLGYIQNTPGTYVRVKIPGLANMSNRVIHRAELIVQQVVSDPITDALFIAPTYMYIEAKTDNDPTKDAYKPIPYDLGFNSDGSINLTNLGAVAIKTFDGAGNSISLWRLNLSRYVQNIVNKRETVTDFRVSSPYLTKFTLTQGTNQVPVTPQINPTSTKYRVRVGGGSHPTQPMRMRIVYSNIP